MYAVYVVYVLLHMYGPNFGVYDVYANLSIFYIFIQMTLQQIGQRETEMMANRPLSVRCVFKLFELDIYSTHFLIV